MKIVMLALALLVTTVAGAEEIPFKFSDISGSHEMAFTEDFTVLISGVNQYDYDYKITVNGIEAPKVQQTNGGPAGYLALLKPDPDRNSLMPESPEDTVKKVNALLQERMARFDSRKWHATTDSIRKLLKQLGVDPDTLEVTPQNPNPNQFVLEVDGVELTKATRTAGAGGVVVVTVTVTPMPSKIVLGDAKDLVRVSRKSSFPSALNDSVAVKEHIKTHTYRIHFRPKNGVRTSLGPFFSNVKRTAYGKVISPAAADEFILAKTSQGSTSSGVAISWNVEFGHFSHASFGLQWGLAYSPQKESDESILGLMGLCVYPGSQKTVYLSGGIAFGRETVLTGGWEEGNTIGADKELPTSQRYIGRGYLGLSFNF